MALLKRKGRGGRSRSLYGLASIVTAARGTRKRRGAGTAPRLGQMDYCLPYWSAIRALSRWRT